MFLECQHLKHPRMWEETTYHEELHAEFEADHDGFKTIN